MTMTALDDHLHWYKDAIIYELHIKAFCDSNGDGIGDFGGLIKKLDYLEDLGVTAIWVLPFYPSPLRDDGYDIADYFSINPSYGSIADFKTFLDEAHKRKLKVITELVINHTSDMHPWFQRARRAPIGSPERNFYVWTDDPHRYKDVRIIFQDFEASNWTWDAVAQQYYWHRFFSHQPDLNYDNPLVQEEVFKIIDYWCKMGVDGFRLDAVPYLFEREGTNGENLPETHEFLKKLRAHVDKQYPGTVLLAEANMWPEDSASYFGNGDECHMNYHFPVMPRLFMALRMEDRYPITDIFDQTPEIPPTCQWAIFLRNHDELTLEMVTDEERDYMYKVYAKDPKARINLGIRHRLAPLVENNRRKIELLNCLLFSLRGTPVIYYGDEIGMGDNFYLGDRDGVRTPMQWSPDRNAGFSNANPQQLYLPLILDPEYHYESVNVETQARNPSSLLWFMKRMINLRKRYRAFGRGDMKFINVDNPKVIAFTRTYEDQTILVVANLSRYSQPAELDLNEFKGFRLVEVFSKNEFPVVKENQPYFFTLDSNTYEWFLLENAQKGVQEENSLSEITLSQWSDLMEKEYRQILESSILSSYLLKNTWFAGKQRVIHHIKLVHHAEIPVHGKNVFVLLAEVHYRSGLPEVYHIPVAMVTGKTAKKLSEDNPNAVLCKITVAEKEGLLADALYTTPYQHAVIQHLAGNLLVESPVNIMQFKGEEQLKKYIAGNPVLKSRVISHFKHYTAIAYNNDYFLRVYRQVERTTNPDVELTLFLGQEQNFPGIPKYAGSIEWRSGKDMMTIGLIQELIEYHGTGITFMQERLNNFNERILARNRTDLPPIDIRGSISEPVPFEILSDDFKELLGGPLAEGARLLGAGLGELHLALASRSDIKEFAPEDFSLHYQRSLYSGMQSLVRNTFSNLSRSLGELHFAEKAEAEKLLSRKNDVLNELKNIYKKKIDVSKIRIHGYFTLEQVLFTGKNISIPYLGGDPEKSFSEKRIKRSALRDAAAMIRSFHYVAHEGLRNASLREDEILRLSPYYSLWTHYLSGFFMHAYLEKVKGTSLIPKEKTDLELLLKTYLIETAIFNLNHVMRKQPQLIIVPLRFVNTLLEEGK